MSKRRLTGEFMSFVLPVEVLFCFFLYVLMMDDYSDSDRMVLLTLSSKYILYDGMFVNFEYIYVSIYI